MTDKQFELLCKYLEDIVVMITEIKVNIMKLRAKEVDQ